MQKRNWFLKITSIASVLLLLNGQTKSGAVASTEGLYPTHSVTVKAPYGYSAGRISVRLSDSEWRIIKRLEPLTRLPEVIENLPQQTITWKIEESALTSPTLQLGMRALQDTRKIFGLLGVQEEPVTVVVGRTQKFIKSQLATLNCFPNTESTNGVFVMGAAVCGYKIIVINLTGYFFYRSVGQRITSAMETRAEPRIANFPYLIIDRNVSGLSHEWVHIVRGAMAEGYVPPDEPAWFREGLAEIVAGIARASSFTNRLNYLGFHVIRIRKFSAWPSRCLLPLKSYRQTGQTVSGCEYLRGATALELLLSYHGGLKKIVSLYRDLVETNDFTESFKRNYGFSLSSFEKTADRYANYINQAARLNAVS